ncbi:MAG TPA: AAA family ATPase, partial [Candidatus Acidoferrales bacterium]|nr:AAA family ATPase [Candidatus Acidoferrales bacterium]
PVTAYEVIAERTVVGRMEILQDTGLTPLIGRERELASLREAFAQATRGHGQLVFVVGEAGIGTSRLLYEFRQQLPAGSHAWIEGRCASYGSSTPFLPIIDALRRMYGIDERDTEVSAVAKVDAGLAPLGADLAWTQPFVRHLLSLPTEGSAASELDAATRRSETFRALKALLLRTAERQPVVFVVEDLHWIDTASEELIRFLADSVPGIAALLICSHRPGYRHQFGDRSYHTRINVQPLSPVEMQTMTASLLGVRSAAPEIEGLIAGKAEGNPLFVEEMTKSLLEQGVLRRQDNHAELSPGLTRVAVPDSIQSVLMARLDRLADEPKRAIQTAAVIGREFALRLLERLAEVGTATVELVDELRSLELIYEKQIHPELAYIFKHALVHDVAYDSILVQRRKQLHSLVGRAVEELYGDRLSEHYEMLAHHFGRAEEWQKALVYHRLAAEKAAAAYANQGVIDHCQAALAIAEKLKGQVDAAVLMRLEELLGQASFVRTHFVESAAAFERAAAVAPDDVTRALNLALAAQSHSWGHQHDQAGVAVETALQLARRAKATSVEAAAIAVKGFRTIILTGNVDEALDLQSHAAQLAESAGDEETAAMAWVLLGQHAEWTASFRHAIDVQKKVSEVGHRRHLSQLVIWPAWFIGKALCCLGDYGNAIAYLEEACELSRRLGARRFESRLLNTLGWCFAEFGSYEQAHHHNQQAVELSLDMGDPEIISNAEINLALNHLELGDIDAAGKRLEAIRARIDAQDPFMRWRYSLHLLQAEGRLALACRQIERAAACADEQLARAQRHKALKIEARAGLLRAEALMHQERWTEAAAACAAAIDLGEKISHPAVTWRALSLAAEVNRRTGNSRTAAELKARCQNLVESLRDSLTHGESRDNLAAAVRKTAPGLWQ